MSSAPGGALVESAKDLFAVMSSPFEADPRSINYQGEFTLPVNSERAFFNRDEVSAYFYGIIGRDLDGRKHLHAAVGTLPGSDRLGFQSLALPLHVPNDDEYLFLRRTPDSVEPSHVKMNEANEPQLKLVTWGRGVATKLNHRLIDQTLENFDYRLPAVFTDPDSVRLGLAELGDQALDWSSREEIATSCDPGASTTFTRNVAHFEGTDEDGDPRSYYATKLGAIFEREVRPGLFQRWRIFFSGDDSLVDLPRVYLQRIGRPSAVAANPADSKTHASSAEPVAPSAALLNELAAGILATMVELD
jgi:hypothetical protein